MSESQSRYSMVERLTNTKLEIMELKAKLEEELEKKKNRIEDVDKQLVDWNEDIKEIVSRERRSKERELEDAERSYEVLIS